MEAFLEKSEGPAPTNRINAGAYVIERDVVEELIPPGRAVSFEREVFPRWWARALYGFAADGYWVDIGTPERYLEATYDLLAGPRGIDAAAARRDRLADRRGLPHQRRPHRPADGARRPLLGGQRLHRGALGAARPRDRGRRLRRSATPCSRAACAWATGRASSRARSWAATPRSGTGRWSSPTPASSRARRSGTAWRERSHAGRRARPAAAARRRALARGGRRAAGGGRARGPAGVRHGRLGDRRRPGGRRDRRRARPAPLRVVRGYAPEPWLDSDTLVLCSSYSGNTEETLACFEAAGAAGAPRVALTTGGALAERARDEGVPVIGVPSGMQPRAAVVYMTVGALGCAAAAGAAPDLRVGGRGGGRGARGAGRRPRARRARRGAARHAPGGPRRRAHRGARAPLEDPAERERQGRGLR